MIGNCPQYMGRRQVHLMDQLLGLALNTFGHFPVCWPSYAPSTAAGLLGHMLPAGLSRIQANRSPIASFGALVSPRRLSCQAVHPRIGRFPGNHRQRPIIPWYHLRWLRSKPARRFAPIEADVEVAVHSHRVDPPVIFAQIRGGLLRQRARCSTVTVVRCAPLRTCIWSGSSGKPERKSSAAAGSYGCSRAG